MIEADVAIIGGTGIGERLIAMGGETVSIPTEYGSLEGRLVNHEGVRLVALQRHSAGHRTPPHRVNYRAMAVGLKAMQVKACFASAAVGSLHAEWAPGTLAVCTDTIDLTGRRLTLFDSEVSHTDMSDAFPMNNTLAAAAHELGQDVRTPCVYVGLDGPRYETPAEIRMVKLLGGDVVGMTASTEAILFREASVPYSCMAVVTNLGCGLSESALNHGEVTNAMEDHGETVVKILLRAAKLTLS